MRISINWLKQFVEVKETPQELADLLTMLGLEAEVAIDFSDLRNIVSAQILSVNDIPDSDHLKLCEVDDGEQTTPIVCGAPNVTTGQKVILAKIGAILPDGNVIKKVRISGKESYGMICSERELGISDDHSGIMVLPDDTLPGQAIHDLLYESLAALELDITPNRPDVLSHIGVAREIAVKTGRKLKLPGIETELSSSKNAEAFRVVIDDPDGCPRYIAGIVKGVTVGPSPQWMVDRLLAAGQRSINNIVDISNYVLLEMGHPTHIFDYDLFPENEVRIRFAKKCEIMITLDEQKHELDESHLLITDGEKPVALAGIMGGLNSAVSGTTTTVLIESAYFDPVTVRKGSKSLGMLTESSRRFERGADPEGTVIAFWRIVDLLKELAGGQLASEMIDEYPKNITPPVIKLKRPELDLIAGHHFGDEFIRQTLRNLEVSCRSVSANEWECIPPSFRPDLEREIDLIEEIIRVYGYDNITASPGFHSVFTYDTTDPLDKLRRVRDILSSLGYHQCNNNSLQAEDWACANGKNPVLIMNPLSKQMSAIRTSLIPGLVQTLDYNIKNGEKNLMLFEIGQVHEQQSAKLDGIVESSQLCGIGYGLIEEKDVHQDANRAQSLFSVKGHLEVLLKQLLHQVPLYNETEHNELDNCFTIIINKKSIGHIGVISPDLIGKLDFQLHSVWCFILNVDSLLEEIGRVVKYVPVSVFPTVERDINFVVDTAIKSGNINKKIMLSGKGLIKSVRPTNIYQHPDLGINRKSIVFNLVFQSDSRTLEDKEVNSIIDEIVSVVSQSFGAKLRA